MKILRKPALSILCLCAFGHAFADESVSFEDSGDGRPTLAIQKVQIAPALLEKLKKDGSESTVRRVLESSEAGLASTFTSAGAFAMVSRSNLDAALKEQNFGDSGNADSSDSNAEAGKFAKGKYVLSILFTNFQDDLKTVNFATLGKTVETRTLRMEANVEILNASTGKIIAAPQIGVMATHRSDDDSFKNTTGGSMSDYLIAKLARQLNMKIAVKTADILVPALILDKTGSTVTISRGKDSNVQIGDVYEVFAVKEKVDKRTRRKMNVEICVGKIKIIRTTPDTAQGSALQDDGIDSESEPYQVARLLEEPEENAASEE